MKSLCFIFSTPPHGNSNGREGVDAILAASAYSENISVIFMGDGVYQLLNNQQPDSILMKHYAPMFKLFELYDIEQVFVSQTALQQRSLTATDLMIDVDIISDSELQRVMQTADSLLSF